jgi:hypothetical protein
MINKVARIPLPDPNGNFVPASQKSRVPDPNGNFVPTAQKSKVPDPNGTSNPVSYIQNGNPIVEMQQELVNLQKTLSTNEHITKWTASKYNEQSLGSFLFENINYSNVMPIIGYVGAPNSKNVPDGRWGTNTQAALKAAANFIDGILSATKKLGYTTHFDMSAFNELAQNIPPNDAKAEIAEKLTTFISAINAAIPKFIDLVLSKSKDHDQYVSGQKSFNVFQSSQSTLSKKQLEAKNELVKKNVPIGISIPADLSDNANTADRDLHDSKPTFNDIVSMKNLMNFIKTNGIKVGGKDASQGKNINLVIEYLKSKLNSGATGY